MANDVMILPRVNADETTFAVVRFAGVGKQDFFKVLKRAVTRWVQETPEGHEAWEDSCDDLNIGDLSAYESDRALQHCLQQAGIARLSIEVYCDTEPVYGATYDDVLVEGE
jgi:hypothetical protein